MLKAYFYPAFETRTFCRKPVTCGVLIQQVRTEETLSPCSAKQCGVKLPAVERESERESEKERERERH